MSTSLSQKQLVRQSVWTLGQQLAGASISLATTVVLARLLGPSGQGLYGIVATTAMLSGMCVNLGTPAATTYAVSRGQTTVLQALEFTLAVTLLLGGTGACIVALLCWLCSQALWPGVPPHYVLWACALIPTILAVQLLAAILQGAQAFARYNTMALVAPCVTLVSTVVVLGWGMATGAALGCLVLGQACAIVWGVSSIKKLSQTTPSSKVVVRPTRWLGYLRSLLGFGLMAAIANALAYSSYRIDIFLLSAWLPRASVGYYSVAASIAERLWLLSGAVNMVLFAQVARSHAEPGFRPIENHTPMLVRHVFWLVTLAGTLLYAVAPWVLPLLFGVSYVASVAPLGALLPGVVVFNVARILSQDLAGRGLVHINVVVGTVCLALNVLGNIVLIPKYGTIGAAWASSLSYSVDSLVKLVVYARLTHTRWTKLIFLQREDWSRIRRWRQ